MKKNLIAVLLIVLGALLIWGTVDAEPTVVKALIILWVAAVLWLSEAIHVTATAMLVPVLAVGFQLMSVNESLGNFAHPIIYVFLGGYGLAAAMRAQQLDQYIAHGILGFTQGYLHRAVILLCLAASCLSMWISNMATAALMLPLILGLVQQKEALSSKTTMFCLLGIAYSANIGGIATLVGSAPNGITAGALNMSFIDWLQIGGLAYLILWPIMMWILWRLLKPDFGRTQVNLADFHFEWNRPRLLMVAIFLFTVVGWVFSKPLAAFFNVSGKFEALVALITLVLLMFSRVVSWKQVQTHTDWGVLLLFGGGLTLGAVLKTSGASVFLGTLLSQLVAEQSTLVILIVLVSFVVFLTELTSNTATTALLVPIFIALPSEFISSQQAALAVGITASCAFMLPVATPPNALVHGTGLIRSDTMIRVGLVLNIVSIVIISALLMIMY